MRAKFPLCPLGENVFLTRVDDYDGAMVTGISPMLRDRQGLRARVVAVGPGKPLPDGGHIPLYIQVGDVVLIGRATGAELNLAGQQVVACRESDLLGVLSYAH